MNMICSTLSGMMAIKHPTLGVLVREDAITRRQGFRKNLTEVKCDTKGPEAERRLQRLNFEGLPDG